MTRQVELRRRIRVGVGAVVAITTVLAAVTVFSILHLLADYRATSAEASDRVDDLVALRAQVESITSEYATLTRAGEASAAVRASIASEIQRLDVLLRTSSAPSAELTAELREHLVETRELLDRKATGATSEHITALIGLEGELDGAIGAEPVRALGHAEATIRATVLRVLGLWAGGAAVAFFAVRRLSGAVLPRLSALADIAAQFGDGDLVARIDPGPNDEIGRVARTFNRMADRLGDAHAAMDHRAHTDELTGLATRRRFWDQLEQALSSPDRDHLVVLFVDLDGFKDVNDKHGHDAGDELLRIAGERLTSCVRAGDTVARLGGDEFGVIAPRLAGSRQRDLARRLEQALSEPIAVGDDVVRVSASVGTAEWRPGLTGEALVVAADTAMYAAKRAARFACRDAPAARLDPVVEPRLRRPVWSRLDSGRNGTSRTSERDREFPQPDP